MTDVITTVTVSNGELGSYRPTAFNKPVPRLRDRKLKNCRSRPPSAQGDARLPQHPVTPWFVSGVRNTASGSETAAQRGLLKGYLRSPVPGTGIQRGGRITADVFGNVVNDPHASLTGKYITCRLVEPGQCFPDSDCSSLIGALPAYTRMSPTEQPPIGSAIGGRRPAQEGNDTCAACARSEARSAERMYPAVMARSRLAV